jgi:GH24 family phage-related lysozyme (muramidase)
LQGERDGSRTCTSITVGLVTVGIGKMLTDVNAAKEFAFVVRATGNAADPDQILADFSAVKKQKAGMLAKNYKQFTALDLPDPKIDELLLEHLAAFQAQLDKNFSGYRAYPEPAQRALLEMIYKLGLDALLKFKKLKSAIEKRDWKAAASECHRHGPSLERNQWTADLFLEAGKS